MRRRLAWIAGAVVAIVIGGALPAGAVGAFGAPQTLVPNAGNGVDAGGHQGGASISADGVVRGFAEDLSAASLPIWYFQRTGTQVVRRVTPYHGSVLSVAWDGVNATYVAFQDGTDLKIANVNRHTGAFSATTTLATGAGAVPYTADVVASGGRWWAVWSEQVGAGGEFAQTELFQQSTLLTRQSRTQITFTATGVWDIEPTLGYYGGKITLVWTRAVNPEQPGPASLRVASTTGTKWLSRQLTYAGSINESPDLIVYGGASYVTWLRDGHIFYADNTTGRFLSHGFVTTGGSPAIGVSLGRVWVAWTATNTQVFVAERDAGVWTGARVTGVGGETLTVLGQGGKARLIYRTTSDIRLRAQA